MKFNHSAASSLKVPAGTVFRILNKKSRYIKVQFFVNFCLQNGTSFGKSQLLNVPTLVKSKQKQKLLRMTDLTGLILARKFKVFWFSNSVF